MEKMTTRGKLIIIGIVVVIVAILFFTLGGNKNSGTASNTFLGNDLGQSSSTNGTPVTAGGGTTPGGTQGSATPAPIVIHLITPVPSDQWKIGQSNPISWDKEAGITGQIQLLNSQTKALVGVILSESGPHQTSYSWDTRQVYLDRYNPLKKDVTAGTYVIRIKFDGNNLGTLTSLPFVIQ